MFSFGSLYIYIYKYILLNCSSRYHEKALFCQFTAIKAFSAQRFEMCLCSFVKTIFFPWLLQADPAEEAKHPW